MRPTTYEHVFVRTLPQCQQPRRFGLAPCSRAVLGKSSPPHIRTVPRGMTHAGAENAPFLH
eukprot:7549903-Pyramimonas_sp.AAC.1